MDVSSTEIEVVVDRDSIGNRELSIDASGKAYGKSSLHINVNGSQQIVMLDGRQVELLLKLLGVVPYA